MALPDLEGIKVKASRKLLASRGRRLQRPLQGRGLGWSSVNPGCRVPLNTALRAATPLIPAPFECSVRIEGEDDRWWNEVLAAFPNRRGWPNPRTLGSFSALPFS
jgi:hypothetical protein